MDSRAWDTAGPPRLGGPTIGLAALHGGAHRRSANTRKAISRMTSRCMIRTWTRDGRRANGGHFVKEQPSRSISELLADHDLITKAIQRAVREAVLQHARAGNPVASWENGEVVWILPEEI